MTAAARSTWTPLRAPLVLCGVGFGGFFDGIVFHQILQLHHMLSNAGNDRIGLDTDPVSTVAGLELNTLWDGLFHAATYLALVAGVFWLWARWRRLPPVRPPWSLLVGALLVGWGVFNVVEGIINHHLLAIHHVVDGDDTLVYDPGLSRRRWRHGRRRPPPQSFSSCRTRCGQMTMTSWTDATRSGRHVVATESRTALQPFRLALASRHLLHRTTNPTTVIVLPGLAGNDASTIPLRWYLQRLGHRVKGWELGVHGPHVMDTLQRFTQRLEHKVDEAGEPITLVGWSLGGVIAREVARDRPHLVSQVFTLGSPINGARHTSAPWVYDEPGHQVLGRINTQRRRRPIRVPVTTIYSRRDGVVDWRHAIDDHTPTAVNVEVGSSHFGLGIDPDVWRIIADAIDDHSTADNSNGPPN